MLVRTGNRTGYRLGGGFVPGRPSYLHRARSRTFLLGDVAGRVLYSVDGLTWKSTATGLGVAGVAEMSVGNGLVMVNDGSNTLAPRISTDGLRSWRDAKFIATGATGGVANIGLLAASSNALTMDGDTSFGTIVNGFGPGRVVNDRHGVTRYWQEFGAGPLIVPGVTTPTVLPVTGPGSGTAGRVSALHDEWIYSSNTAADAINICSTRVSLDGVSPGVVTGTGYAYSICAGPDGVLAVGNTGSVVQLRPGVSGHRASDWRAGTVGFTAANLMVALWNGENFLVAGAGGVVGISQDGVTWAAVSTGFASDIECGLTTPSLFA